MMKTRLSLSLSLLAVFLVACAAGTSTVAPAPPEAAATDANLPTLTPLADTSVPAEPVAAATVLPVATSRGPDLHATDPTTVSLAAGQLQLVEFFRFT